MKKFFLGAEKSDFINVEIADNFFKRFRGLMFREKIPSRHALFIAPCNSIHMCFMRFSIDAVFIDSEYKILKIVRNLCPWIGFSICLNAFGVLELKSGEANRIGLKVGQKFF